MTEPLTPQQKIEYLASKLEGVALEAQAVTGLRISVDIHIADVDMPHTEIAELATVCDDLGADKGEWKHADKGGWYHFDLNGGDLYLSDSEMVHEPKLSPIADGFEGAVESLVSQ